MLPAVSADGITVVTVTRGRSELLRRATLSVLRQVCTAPIQHLILIDDCLSTAADIAAAEPGVFDQSDVLFVARTPNEHTGPSRLGYLRNMSVRLATRSWIAFLDDDNVLESDHFQTLLEAARSYSCGAVHSHRRLFLPDGTPYVEPMFPWCRDPAIARAEYERLCAAGVFVRGSNVVRDAVDLARNVRMVDMGEWLFERELLARIGFQEKYSISDWRAVVPEDNKLLADLVALNIPIATTGRPTLRYYLGGYSNSAMVLPNVPSDTWLPAEAGVVAPGLSG